MTMDRRRGSALGIAKPNCALSTRPEETAMKMHSLVGMATACGLAIAGSAGCGEHASTLSSSGGVVPVSTGYVVTLQAASVGGLGRCPDLGAVGLVTSTSADGGVSYSPYYCRRTSD